MFVRPSVRPYGEPSASKVKKCTQLSKVACTFRKLRATFKSCMHFSKVARNFQKLRAFFKSCGKLSVFQKCTLHDFLSSKVRFIHTSTVTRSYSCSGKTMRTTRVYLVDSKITITRYLVIVIDLKLVALDSV